MSYQVSIIIEKDEHGYYAYCPELEEVKANIKEAVELYLETLSQNAIESTE